MTDLNKLRDELAEKYSGFEPKEEWSGLNLIARDQFVGFKAGFDAALQALSQMAPSFDSKTEFELSKKDYPSEENESQRIVSTIAAGAQNAGKNLMHQRLVPIIKAKDIQIATLRAELHAKDLALTKIDDHIRVMRVEGLIDMKEMCRALKVISDALQPQGGNK